MPRYNNVVRKVSALLLRPGFVDAMDTPCRLIVELAGPAQFDRVASIIHSSEGKIHREMNLIRGAVVELPYAAIRDLALSRYVKRIWHDAAVHIMLDVAVPTVGGAKAQESGYTGKGVTVAVIDTGIYPHPDLTMPENRIVGWNDLVGQATDPYDDNGHGTHVAGIIAGNGISSRGRYKGMAPEAGLVGVKALDQNGEGSTSDIIAAIEWCINSQSTYNIRAINMSLGGTAQDSYRNDPLCRAVAAAWDKGIAVCVAAGNDGPDPQTINSPGISPKAITVGNLDDKDTIDPSDDTLNDSSSRGPTIDRLLKPDILAPGTNIMSLKVRGGYRSLTGTSMSTPMVAGAIAQLAQKSPSMKPDEFVQNIKKFARTINLQNVEQGAGALNLEGLFSDSTTNDQPKNSFNLDKLNKLLPYAAVFLVPMFLGL